MNYELVKLQNGTFSVRSIAEGETFHPVIGPAAEAETLYVKQLALPERIRASREPLIVWDVGLGAGANAMAVVRATESSKCALCLHSFDRTLEPLQFALEHASQLGYLSGYESTVRRLIDCGAVHICEAQRTVHWQLHIGSFPELLGHTELFRDISPHAILFDPFSPATNPEMWTLSLFSRIYQLLNPERPCALATYSRSTMLRVSLLLAGFHVGRGHASGEKEETTIAANTPELIAHPLDRRWLGRVRRSTSAEPLMAPVYRQAPLSVESWERLLAHPQFNSVARL